MTAVSYYLLWAYPTRDTRGRRFVALEVDQRTIDAVERRFRVGWPTYLAGTFVALVLPLAGLLVFLGLALFYLLPYLIPASAGEEGTS